MLLKSSTFPQGARSPADSSPLPYYSACPTSAKMSSAPEYDTFQEDVDRVLRLHRQKHGKKACIPCHRRKVRCNGAKPCQTCLRRGHSQICIYNLAGMVPPLITTDQGPCEAAVEQPGMPIPNSMSLPSLDGSPKYKSNFCGNNSSSSILPTAVKEFADCVGPVLGQLNTYDSYPFMETSAIHDRNRSLVQILPSRSEVSQFYHFYRNHVHPLMPMIVDINSFESELCRYLSSYAANELQNPDSLPTHWRSNDSVGFFSLLLAALSVGIHFSNLDLPYRAKLCLDFARRSMQGLRLANFLFRPSLNAVQTLIIIGNVLQNNGQSDAAWSFLGTTVRLAQSMGLHVEPKVPQQHQTINSIASSIWNILVWQDVSISSCYDRPPIVANSKWLGCEAFSHQNDLCYAEVMISISRIWLELAGTDMLDAEVQAGRLLHTLQAVDDILQRAQQYLQSRQMCQTLQQHIEHLCLKILTAGFVSFLSRPALRQSFEIEDTTVHSHLLSRAKASLFQAPMAFLNLHDISVVPMRTWTMIHIVLWSTLVLSLWKGTRDDPECRDLQQKVILAFSSNNLFGKCDTRITGENPWISKEHIQAFIALLTALGNNNHNRPNGPVVPNLSELQQNEPTTVLESDIYRDHSPCSTNCFGSINFNDSIHLSSLMTDCPVTNIDSIMNSKTIGAILEDVPLMINR